MLRALGAALAVIASLAPGAPASERDKQRPNDPSLCPWCHGDAALMEAAGIVSHGGFRFGRTDTAEIDGFLATSDIRWIETPHFEIGLAIETYRIRLEEKEKLRVELARLREVLPDVPAKPKSLDPWLRAHLYAQRAEELWQRFLQIAKVDAAAFPDGSRPWDMTGRYMGEGPYLGMKGKYEILVLPSEAAAVDYLDHQFGLRHRKTQRWHLTDTGTLSVTIHTDEGELRYDPALHGHVAFNLTHNFLDGYKQYAYDTPVWLHEGLAHVLERELDPEYNTFDSSEGAVAEETSKARWEPEVLKLIGSGKAPRMAELVNLKTYAELELEHHFVTWSMIDYLLRTDPDGFARLLDGLKGMTNDKGYSDGSNLADRQRELFREVFGKTYAQFDAAWAEWAQTAYREKPKK